jgi:hypothetical protein
MLVTQEEYEMEQALYVFAKEVVSNAAHAHVLFGRPIEQYIPETIMANKIAKEYVETVLSEKKKNVDSKS